LTWFTGGFFSSPDLKTLIGASSTGGDILFSLALDNGTTAVCEVDPAIVAPRRFRLVDSAGITRFTLDLSGYQNFNGIIWPTRLSATALPRPGESAQRIDVSFEDVEFNAELAPQAFVPPPSAKRQP
jgi:outer membrane lipoprotein-sorting protein